MVDREKVMDVLARTFPGTSREALEFAARAIVGLDDEWEEVTSKEPQLGYHYSRDCIDICYLADQIDRGAEFRLFRRRIAREW